MAREASVRLTLDNASFIVSMRRAGDEVESVGKKGQKAMGVLNAATDAAKRSALGLAGSLKNAAMMVATLGGAFSVGGALKGAVQLQTSYRQIAFGVREANGAMLTAARVQEIAERAAAKTGKSNAEMATTFHQLREATGDVDFARESLEAVGDTALGTGEDLSTVADLADQLHTKFGVTAKGMRDALAQVIDQSKQGGPSFAQFADVVSGAGAELLRAGLDGQRGLDFMLGALVRTDDKFKNLPKQVAGLKAVLRGLGEQGELKKLAGALGINASSLINEKDAIARLRRILGTGQKGVKALLGSMHENEEKDTMKILFTDPFETALADAQKAGLSGKAAIDRALRVFDGQISEFGKAQIKGADVAKRAAEERQSPEQQLNQALNRLTTAFSQPSIIKAIDDLAKNLPKLADLIAKVVSFAADNPVTAGALGVAGKVAIDAGGSALVEVVKSVLLKRLAGAAAGGLASAVGGAGAGAAAGGAAAIGGKALAFGLGGGPVAAIGAAIAAGGLIAADQIGSTFDRERDKMRELASATAAGFGGGTRDAKQQALERLYKAYDKVHMASANGELGGGGFFDKVGGLFGEKTMQQRTAEQMKLASEAIAKLVTDLNAKEQKEASRVVTMADTNIVGRVRLDTEASRAIATATTTALGGKVLTVRLANPGDISIGPVSVGPGGSRGPMAGGPLRPGGAV